MEEKKINEQESLELITLMIQNTRKKINENSGVPFIIWGYVTVIVSVFEFFVIYLNMNNNLMWGWFLIPILGWSLMAIYWKRKSATNLPTTFIDRAISSVWIVIGISSLIAFPAAILYKIGILFMMTLLMGIGTAITGLIIKYNILTISGFIGIIGSLAFSLPLSINSASNILIFAIIFTLMMIIPGHILNSKSKNNV